MRTRYCLPLVLLLTAGCATPRAAGALVKEAAGAGFCVGAVLAFPADIAALPVTLPLGLAAGIGVGRHGGLGAGVYILGLPSLVCGGATGAALGAAALVPAAPIAIIEALGVGETAPSGTPPETPEERPDLDTRAIQAMVDALAGPRSEMMIRQLAGRQAAVPLLIRALDDPRRGPSAARALAAHADLPLGREALERAAMRPDGDPATREAARAALREPKRP